jgi:ketosteroid isomerase-like protein
MSDDIDAVLSTWTAAERDGDAAALDDLLADDFLGVGPLGFTLSKEDWLSRPAAGLKYQAFELADVRIRHYGDTAVVVATQNTTGTYQGREVPGSVRVSLVVANADGARKLAGAHISFIAGTPGAPPIPGRPRP